MYPVVVLYVHFLSVVWSPAIWLVQHGDSKAFYRSDEHSLSQSLESWASLFLEQYYYDNSRIDSRIDGKNINIFIGNNTNSTEVQENNHLETFCYRFQKKLITRQEIFLKNSVAWHKKQFFSDDSSSNTNSSIGEKPNLLQDQELLAKNTTTISENNSYQGNDNSVDEKHFFEVFYKEFGGYNRFIDDFLAKNSFLVIPFASVCLARTTVSCAKYDGESNSEILNSNSHGVEQKNDAKKNKAFASNDIKEVVRIRSGTYCDNNGNDNDMQLSGESNEALLLSTGELLALKNVLLLIIQVVQTYQRLVYAKNENIDYFDTNNNVLKTGLSIDWFWSIFASRYWFAIQTQGLDRDLSPIYRSLLGNGNYNFMKKNHEEGPGIENSISEKGDEDKNITHGTMSPAEGDSIANNAEAVEVLRKARTNFIAKIRPKIAHVPGNSGVINNSNRTSNNAITQPLSTAKREVSENESDDSTHIVVVERNYIENLNASSDIQFESAIESNINYNNNYMRIRNVTHDEKSYDSDESKNFRTTKMAADTSNKRVGRVCFTAELVADSSYDKKNIPEIVAILRVSGGSLQTVVFEKENYPKIEDNNIVSPAVDRYCAEYQLCPDKVEEIPEVVGDESIKDSKSDDIATNSTRTTPKTAIVPTAEVYTDIHVLHIVSRGNYMAYTNHTTGKSSSSCVGKDIDAEDTIDNTSNSISHYIKEQETAVRKQMKQCIVGAWEDGFVYRGKVKHRWLETPIKRNTNTIDTNTFSDSFPGCSGLWLWKDAHSNSSHLQSPNLNDRRLLASRFFYAPGVEPSPLDYVSDGLNMFKDLVWNFGKHSESSTGGIRRRSIATTNVIGAAFQNMEESWPAERILKKVNGMSSDEEVHTKENKHMIIENPNADHRPGALFVTPTPEMAMQHLCATRKLLSVESGNSSSTNYSWTHNTTSNTSESLSQEVMCSQLSSSNLNSSSGASMPTIINNFTISHITDNFTSNMAAQARSPGHITHNFPQRSICFVGDSQMRHLYNGAVRLYERFFQTEIAKHDQKNGFSNTEIVVNLETDVEKGIKQTLLASGKAIHSHTACTYDAQRVCTFRPSRYLLYPGGSDENNGILNPNFLILTYIRFTDISDLFPPKTSNSENITSSDKSSLEGPVLQKSEHRRLLEDIAAYYSSASSENSNEKSNYLYSSSNSREYNYDYLDDALSTSSFLKKLNQSCSDVVLNVGQWALSHANGHDLEEEEEVVSSERKLVSPANENVQEVRSIEHESALMDLKSVQNMNVCAGTSSTGQILGSRGATMHENNANSNYTNVSDFVKSPDMIGDYNYISHGSTNGTLTMSEMRLKTVHLMKSADNIIIGKSTDSINRKVDSGSSIDGICNSEIGTDKTGNECTIDNSDSSGISIVTTNIASSNSNSDITTGSTKTIPGPQPLATYAASVRALLKILDARFELLKVGSRSTTSYDQQQPGHRPQDNDSSSHSMSVNSSNDNTTGINSSNNNSNIATTSNNISNYRSAKRLGVFWVPTLPLSIGSWLQSCPLRDWRTLPNILKYNQVSKSVVTADEFDLPYLDGVFEIIFAAFDKAYDHAHYGSPFSETAAGYILQYINDFVKVT